ncbi:MAG: hypothetical protein DSY43_01720, partial [Gammaproteobacteria bacterium]
PPLILKPYGQQSLRQTLLPVVLVLVLMLDIALQSDEENATGDAQLLCELFSGERASYRYATEKTRVIKENTPFSIIGATQVPFAARLITRMNQGHGLLDRFIIVFPSCLRPTVTETEDALEWLKTQPLQSTTDIFLEVHRVLENRNQNYDFSHAAQMLLTDLQKQEITEINTAIGEGSPSPKNKTLDLLKRSAGAIHIFNYVAGKLVDGQRPDAPPSEIQEVSVRRAEVFVHFATSQKNIATEVIMSLAYLTV